MGYSFTSKAYIVVKKRTLGFEERMHVMFDELEMRSENKEDCEFKVLIKGKENGKGSEKNYEECSGDRYFRIITGYCVSKPQRR